MHSAGVKNTELVKVNECEWYGARGPNWEEGEETRSHLKAGKAVQRRVFLHVPSSDVKAGTVPGAAQPLPSQESCNSKIPTELSGQS